MRERQRTLKKFYRKWHSWLGFALVLPLIFFTVTGLLLNHSQDLDLDQKRVRSEWVMAQYGLKFDDAPVCYRLESGAAVALWQGQLIFKNRLVAEAEEFIGASELQKGVCLATEDRIHYLSADGELIETLDELVLPKGKLQKIGMTAERSLVVATSSGEWIFDHDLVEARKLNIDSMAVSWSEVADATEEEITGFKKTIIGEGMPLDRVVLDVHSGNLFNTVGKVLVDVFGIGILLVCLTGMILYVRTNRRRKNRIKESGAKLDEEN